MGFLDDDIGTRPQVKVRLSSLIGGGQNLLVFASQRLPGNDRDIIGEPLVQFCHGNPCGITRFDNRALDLRLNAIHFSQPPSVKLISAQVRSCVVLQQVGVILVTTG